MAYQKTTWETDDVITKDKLNNIEDGIAQNESAIAANDAAISANSTAIAANSTAITNVEAKTGVVVITLSSISSLPQTASNAAIKSTHVVLNAVLSNPAAQTGDWTVTTSNGSLTISGSISGTTNITLYLGVQTN